jgi:hypothetical protein
MKVWCVKWRRMSFRTGEIVEGWCAVKGNRQPKESEVDRVPTECNHVITFAGRFERRKPTCPECLGALKKKGTP